MFTARDWGGSGYESERTTIVSVMSMILRAAELLGARYHAFWHALPDRTVAEETKSEGDSSALYFSGGY